MLATGLQTPHVTGIELASFALQCLSLEVGLEALWGRPPGAACSLEVK